MRCHSMTFNGASTVKIHKTDQFEQCKIYYHVNFYDLKIINYKYHAADKKSFFYISSGLNYLCILNHEY